MKTLILVWLYNNSPTHHQNPQECPQRRDSLEGNWEVYCLWWRNPNPHLMWKKWKIKYEWQNSKNQYWKKATVTEKFEYPRYMIELENGKRLVRNRRYVRLLTKPKHSNMTETNCKQDITINGSEEKHQTTATRHGWKATMSEESHCRQDTQLLWWMATYKSLKCLFYVCMGDVGWLIYISDPI